MYTASQMNGDGAPTSTLTRDAKITPDGREQPLPVTTDPPPIVLQPFLVTPGAAIPTRAIGPSRARSLDQSRSRVNRHDVPISAQSRALQFQIRPTAQVLALAQPVVSALHQRAFSPFT